LGLPDSAFIVLGVGRLAAVKGWPLLIQAIRELRTKRKEVLLLIIGSGEEEQRLRAQVAMLNLDHTVRFLGSRGPLQIAEMMAAANVLAVTSYAEGLSYSMLEAAACGCPIVTTSVSGAKDIVRNGESGFVVDSRDPRLFAQSLSEAVTLEAAATIGPKLVDQRYGDDTLRELIERDQWLLPASANKG